MPRCSKRQASAADALAEARRELDAARAQIAELEQVSLERVGADVAHDTLVSLQQENEAAVAALAAASHELEPRTCSLRSSTDCAPSARAPESACRRSRPGRRSCRTSWRAGLRAIDELESGLAEHASTGEQAEPEPAEPTYDDGNHVLLVPTETGYATLERPGTAPQPGDTVLLPIGRYKVSRRGASPFPEDTRGCAYLIQA